jgi:hypothetical protein
MVGMRARTAISALKNTQKENCHPFSVHEKEQSVGNHQSDREQRSLSFSKHSSSKNSRSAACRQYRVSAASSRIGSAERGERRDQQNNEIRPFWRRPDFNASVHVGDLALYDSFPGDSRSSALSQLRIYWILRSFKTKRRRTADPGRLPLSARRRFPPSAVRSISPPVDG